MSCPASLPKPAPDPDPDRAAQAADEALRQRAEARFNHHAASKGDNLPEPSPQAVQELVHELQVHQIELELQNDELRQSHLAQESARARYFDLYDLAPVGYVTVGANGAILEANLTAATLLGVNRGALVTRPLHAFIAREDQDSYYLLCKQLRETGSPQSGEVRMHRVEGPQLWVHLMATGTTDADGAFALRMALSDISALKAIEYQLLQLAHFDALTGLPNRRLKADRLDQAMANARRTGQGLAVVCIDLDGFKTINDQHGHDAGDQLLIALAGHMQQVLREGDTLARLGGDEFIAVLTNLGDIQVCAPLMDRLLAAAAHPVRFKGHLLRVSASLGVTFYPQAQEVEGDQLMRQADQAMYFAKQAGKNCYQVFDAEQESSLRCWHEDLHGVRQALDGGEFVLHYQPKVNLRTGQLVGVEALIRWQHPVTGLRLPGSFLPVVEDHALAIPIGEWVISTALGQIEAWQVRGVQVQVSVNVGARQLQQPNFVTRLSTLLAQHPKVSPADLTLEILETSALKDIPYVSRVIDECRQIGVTFALDDFGTGYSSLTYLKRLRVASLKIDQSFVQNMLDDPDDLAILKGIISLASAFKCDVIAEGVETEAHGTLLMQLGCDLVQGYCIAQPMPAQDLPGWITGWAAQRASMSLPLSDVSK
ncbi:MAG: EAL domain-containing protein [Rhodoferax sp.]|nr:EAL domain-containing protein [Rhodoferax sp.]